MGQKVNPNGIRLGINKTWSSRWFSKKDYVKLLNGKNNITNENLFIAFENALDILLDTNE